MKAGEMIRSHVKGNRALLITNDRIAPLHLEKYENLLKDGSDNIQFGEIQVHVPFLVFLKYLFGYMELKP